MPPTASAHAAGSPAFVAYGVAALALVLPLGAAALLDGLRWHEALGIGVILLIPTLWILVILGYRDTAGPHDSLERAFVAAHPAIAGLGGLIGFACFVVGQEASLWEILASSRTLFDLHGMDRAVRIGGELVTERGGPLIEQALDEFLYGVGIAALLWHGIRKLRARAL